MVKRLSNFWTLLVVVGICALLNAALWGRKGLLLFEPDSSTTNDSKFEKTSQPSWPLPAYTYFILLVLQAGCQPLLIKFFMPTTIVRSVAVLSQEGMKFVFSIMFFAASGNAQEAGGSWTIRSAIFAAGIPAALYAVQNYCNLMAAQILPPVTFVVLNQTKTLTAAFCCFLLMGQKQSQVQILALILLVFAMLVVQKIIPLECAESPPVSTKSDYKEPAHGRLDGNETEDVEKVEVTSMDSSSKEAANEETGRQLTMGFMSAVFASFLSGLAGTLAQKVLQTFNRSPHIFNMELSVFSSIFLLGSLAAGTPDRQKIMEGAVGQGWTWKTWIPVVTNALGGILVGMVTKYQGAVVKGFAMIFGMVISGILQQVFAARSGGGVTKEQVAGALLGGLSLYLHSSYPQT